MKKIILAYNFTPERLKSLRTLCLMLKVQLRPVTAAEVETPVGILAGLLPDEKAAALKNSAEEIPGGKKISANENLNGVQNSTGQNFGSTQNSVSEDLTVVPKLELLFLCGFDQNLLNRLLTAIRKSRLQKVELKAMLTPTNITWSGAKLLREISAEHVYMKKNFEMKHQQNEGGNHMKEFTFAFGHGEQKVSLPEEKIIQVMEGHESSKCTDVKAAVIEAMRHPINSKPLQQIVKAGDTVGIIVSDITRSWIKSDQFLIHIVNELNLAGVPDKDIFIMIAAGTHRSQTPAEDEIVCGKEVASRIKIYQHDSLNMDNHKLIGTTKHGTPVYIEKRIAEADKVILTGGITAHLLAGYGGGRKSVVPGVAANKTIQFHHTLSLDPVVGKGTNALCANCNLETNPFHHELMACCELLNPAFIVNGVYTAEGDFNSFVAGDWKDAWLEGCKRVEKIQGVACPEQADVVIASSGGYPKDINMYQGSKTYDTAALAVKKDGIMVLVMECEDIKEPPSFSSFFHYDDLLQMEKDLRADYSIPFWVALKICLLAKNQPVIMVTKPENFEFVKHTGQIPVTTLKEAWALVEKLLAERGKKDYTITLMPHAANTVPLLGK